MPYPTLDFRAAFFAVGLLLAPGTWTAAATTPDFQLCRTIHGRQECISFKKGCTTGVAHAVPDGQTPVQCRKLSSGECEGLENLVDLAFQRIQALPAAQREIDKLGGMTCDGFLLGIPGHAATACNYSQPQGAQQIHRAMMAILTACK